MWTPVDLNSPLVSASLLAEVTANIDFIIELDPGDQMAPNITCYFCTVVEDSTLGLQLSGTHAERLKSLRASTFDSVYAILLIHTSSLMPSCLLTSKGTLYYRITEGKMVSTLFF